MPPATTSEGATGRDTAARQKRVGLDRDEVVAAAVALVERDGAETSVRG